MAMYDLVDSYSVGVESGWGSQMVGVFDSPDGCSVWCSVTLGRLIDMLPPSPPSLRLLFLHLLLRHTHCYEDGYQPPGLLLQILRGWDGTFHLAQQKKISMFGIILMTPICHCQICVNCLWEVRIKWFEGRTDLGSALVLCSALPSQRTYKHLFHRSIKFMRNFQTFIWKSNSDYHIIRSFCQRV